MALTKKELIDALTNLDVPDDAPIASFYNFDESFDFYDKLNVKEITPEHYGDNYNERDYIGLVVTIE